MTTPLKKKWYQYLNWRHYFFGGLTLAVLLFLLLLSLEGQNVENEKSPQNTGVEMISTHQEADMQSTTQSIPQENTTSNLSSPLFNLLIILSIIPILLIIGIKFIIKLSGEL